MKKKVEIFTSKWLKLAAKNRHANFTARANLTAPTVHKKQYQLLVRIS
jgi:hypothetical protein